MIRAFLILSVLTIIVSVQSSGKGFRTIIQSSFPIDAPLHFDPSNEERLVLSIVKPSSDASSTTDDKHRIRIINIDHKLSQKDLTSKETQSDSGVSISARLTKQNESPKAILSNQPAIDYGLPTINLKDEDFAPHSKTKYVSQKLSSRLFVSKIPSAEELLKKGYVLTDIYPLEFTSDDSEFEFPSDRFFRLPPNNVDGQLRPPEDSSRKYTSELPQNKSEPQTVFKSKIGSTKPDEATDVAARPLEVKYMFLPRTNQAEFHLGKKYISKFLSPAVAYDIPGTERGSGEIIKNKQGISTQQSKEGAGTNSFVSSKSEAAGSKIKEIPQIKYALPSSDKDKKAFVSSVFGDYSAENGGGLKSRLASSESGNLQSGKSIANERGALNNRAKETSGIETQQSGLFTSRSENSNKNVNTKTSRDRQDLKKYSLPSPSNEGSVFSSKLGEASSFQKQSIVKTEKAFSSQLAEGKSETESRNSGGATKPEEFAVYYKTPNQLGSKYEIPKSNGTLKKSIWYSAVPKGHQEQSQANPSLSYKVPEESEAYAAPFNTGQEKSTSVVKSFESFEPEKFAIYYKTPLTQSGERLAEHTRGEVQFLGIPSTSTSSQDVSEANLKIPSDVYGVPYVSGVVQSNSPVSADYESQIVNSDTIQAFEGNSERVLIVYQPVSGDIPPSVSYGTPLLSLLSSDDIRKALTPFAEYSIPTGFPGDDQHLNLKIPSGDYGVPHVPGAVQNNSSVPAEYELPTVNSDRIHIFGGNPEKVSVVYQSASDVTPSGSPGDNQHPDSDINTVPNSHFIASKPSLEYGTPNIASSSTNVNVRKQAERLTKQKTYESGVPVLKVPNTRPLSSYEVPVY